MGLGKGCTLPFKAGHRASIRCDIARASLMLSPKTSATAGDRRGAALPMSRDGVGHAAQSTGEPKLAEAQI